jgi:hypothetical protein
MVATPVTAIGFDDEDGKNYSLQLMMFLNVGI